MWNFFLKFQILADYKDGRFQRFADYSHKKVHSIGTDKKINPILWKCYKISAKDNQISGFIKMR